MDDGHEYLRRCGNRAHWEELSEVVEDAGKTKISYKRIILSRA